MKAKVFDVILHRLGHGSPPSAALEERLNAFLSEHPKIQVLGSHMNTVMLPPEPHAMPRSEAAEPSVILFMTLLYADNP